MGTLVKIQHNGQVTIPTRLRSRAGLSKGGVVEAVFEHGRIVLTPKPVAHRTTVPNADDEYTPSQRRIIDARLNRAMAEVQKGNVSRAFDSIGEFAVALKADAKKLKSRDKRSARP